MDSLAPTRWASGSRKRVIGAATVPPALVTLSALFPERPGPAVAALLYVFAVVLAARLGGTPAGALASILSFVSLNFFFTSPIHTLSVNSSDDLIALMVFILVAGIVGLLVSSDLRAKSRAERRELEARFVNRLANRLLAGESTESVLAVLAEGVCDLLGADRCEIATSFTIDIVFSGKPQDPPPFVVHMTAHGEMLGEIRVWREGRRGLSGDEQAIIRSLGTQLALALEGIRLSQEVRRAELEAQSNQLKAALFSGVTHDVKTPLAAIMTSVTSLIDGVGFSVDERSEHLLTIKQEAERLHRVVNNLLDVARLRAGALTPVRTRNSIEELVEGVIGRLRALLQGRPIDLRFSENVPEIPMDVVQIDQVLTNLLENAVKFTPPGAPISISVIGNSQVVRVTVADKGPGVPSEDRHRVFEPFQQGDPSSSGTGLGLAIANAVVIAHGGRMWLSDNPAGGAAFTFELPVNSETAETVADGRSRARS